MHPGPTILRTPIMCQHTCPKGQPSSSTVLGRDLILSPLPAHSVAKSQALQGPWHLGPLHPTGREAGKRSQG